MELPALFSLISAAILGLLPVLLLFGRRRMQRRTRSDETAAPPSASARATGQEDADRGERPILGRLVRDDRGEPDERERELREAAIIAGASPAVAYGNRRSAPRTVPRPAAPGLGPSVSETGLGRAERTPAGRHRRQQSIEERLARLTPLQRAVAYSEILGPPAALRKPGRRDEHSA